MAVERVGIRVEADLDVNSFKKAGKEVEQVARDTGKRLDPFLKRDLELNVAKFQTSLDDARKRLKEAKQQGDKDAIINARVETNQLQSGLTEAKRQLNNYVNTGDKDLSRLQAKFNSVNETIKDQGGFFSNLGEQGKKAFDNIKSSLIGFVGAVAGIRGIFSSVQQTIQAESQLNRLNQIIKTATGATDEQVAALNRQAQALERVGVVAAGNVTTTQAQLATFDLQAQTIERLTPAILDYVTAEKGAAASTEDFKQLTNGLAQALQGNFASLSRTGFVLDDVTKELIKNGTEAERSAALVEVLNSTYKDFNANLRNTAEGQLQILRNNFANLREEIGKVFIPILLTLLQTVQPLIEGFIRFAKESPKLATALVGVSGAGGVLLSVLLALGGPITAIVAGIGLLATAVVSVTNVINKKRKEITGLNDNLKELQDKLEENKKAQENLTEEWESGRISLVEYRQEMERLEEEQKKLIEQTDKAVLSLEDIKKAYDEINQNGITTENEREQLKLLREEAIRTRTELNNLIKTIQDNFEKSKKIVQQQRKETEQGIRSLAGAGATADFFGQQLLGDIGNLIQVENELQGVENVIKDIGLALGDSGEQAEKTSRALSSGSKGAKKSADELTEAQKFTKKEQEEIEKNMKKIAEAAQKELEGKAKGAFESLDGAINKSSKNLDDLQKKLQSVGDQLVKIEGDIAKRILQIEQELAKGAEGEERVKLEQELALARANVNEELLAELKRQDALSETERLLEKQAALKAEQEELIKQVEFETKLNADLTAKKEEFLKKVTDTYGIELQKQEQLLRASIDRQLAMYRELSFATGNGMNGGNSTTNNSTINVNANINNEASLSSLVRQLS